jgi:hypothetical protein
MWWNWEGRSGDLVIARDRVIGNSKIAGIARHRRNRKKQDLTAGPRQAGTGELIRKDRVIW